MLDVTRPSQAGEPTDGGGEDGKKIHRDREDGEPAHGDGEPT